MTTSNLSGIQKQFLTVSKMMPESSAYNIISFVKLVGDLDVSRLRHAWHKVFSANEIFRTRYLLVDGNAIASLEDKVELPWNEFQCKENDLFNKLADLFYAPFQLDNAPLVRSALVQISDELHYFAVVQHHIITDLFSKTKIGNLISATYNAQQGEPTASAYSQFVEKEKVYFAQKSGIDAIDFWQNKMEKYPGVLNLPDQKGLKGIFRGAGHSVDWHLPPILVQKLNEIENNVQGQPFLWLLTAYAALLSRFSGQKNFVLGVPLTNRRLDCETGTIGPFVNILPVFIDIHDDDTFSSLYGKIRKEMLFNHRHQEVPFYNIAGFYKGERDLFKPHLLQAGFTSEPLLELKLNGIECTSIPIEKRGSQMDLFFTYWPDGEGYSGQWEFNSDLLDIDLVREFQDSFQILLEDSLYDSGKPLKECRILSPAAVMRQSRWNDTQRAYPLEQNLAGYLRSVFSAHKDKTALIHETGVISYKSMEKNVAGMASHLHRQFGEKGRIALMLNSSPEMVIAIHSVLQSGNAYVPIGTEWPQERILMVLEDIAPATVIAERQFSGMLASLDTPIIFSDTMTDFATEDALYPELSIGPEDSAYIIYTSGSTGKPKGAELPHNGVLNRILWMQEEYGLTSDDRVLQKTPYTFDVSVWEFLWPFFVGACLVTIRPDGHKDPRYVKDAIIKNEISVLHFVPSMLSLFLKALNGEVLASIRHVICSGEALTKGQESAFFNAFDHARLHNLYGPTEASIDVTYWECGQPGESDQSIVPIGIPIANTQMYIVNEFNQLCPPYVSGELLIGGIGLAKGYWNRPELTAEKFVPNPFGAGRLYRTGDLARYRLDGVIEYIGRSDFQVKLRGLRVELGEIESVLESYDGIEKSAVYLWKRAPGDERLVACVTGAGQGAMPSEADLKGFLRLHLPEYMVPSHFIPLTRLPLSPNGKLDRKALPLPVMDDLGKGTVAPEGDTQQTLFKLWREVLSSDNFGADDNFFDAGGQSLSLVELSFKIETAFGTHIEMVDLFQYPTIKGMAMLIEGLKTPSLDQDAHQARALRRKSRDRAGRKR